MIMDTTSKDYYESVIQGYRLYARGRTLEQYCRDEGVDFKWLTKSQVLYGTPDDKPQKKTARKPTKSKTEAADLIKLHYDEEVLPVEGTGSTARRQSVSTTAEAIPTWRVDSLRMTTPSGNEIEIRTTSPAAVSELLAKLAF